MSCPRKRLRKPRGSIEARTYGLQVTSSLHSTTEPHRIPNDKLNVDKIIVFLPENKTTMERGANAGDQRFLLFQQCLLQPSFLRLYKKNCSFFNPVLNKPWFVHVCSTSHLKTLWEKEKLLVTSNFSFSHSVFKCFENPPQLSSNSKLSSANSFSLEECNIHTYIHTYIHIYRHLG